MAVRFAPEFSNIENGGNYLPSLHRRDDIYLRSRMPFLSHCILDPNAVINGCEKQDAFPPVERASGTGVGSVKGDVARGERESGKWRSNAENSERRGRNQVGFRIKRLQKKMIIRQIIE